MNGDISKQETARGKIRTVESYRKFVMKYRNTSRITAVLTEAKTMVELDVKDLDKNGFLLNTPMGTVDLRTGEHKKSKATLKKQCLKLDISMEMIIGAVFILG